MGGDALLGELLGRGEHLRQHRAGADEVHRRRARLGEGRMGADGVDQAVGAGEHLPAQDGVPSRARAASNGAWSSGRVDSRK